MKQAPGLPVVEIFGRFAVLPGMAQSLAEDQKPHEQRDYSRIPGFVESAESRKHS